MPMRQERRHVYACLFAMLMFSVMPLPLFAYALCHAVCHERCFFFRAEMALMPLRLFTTVYLRAMLRAYLRHAFFFFLPDAYAAA